MLAIPVCYKQKARSFMIGLFASFETIILESVILSMGASWPVLLFIVSLYPNLL